MRITLSARVLIPLAAAIVSGLAAVPSSAAPLPRLAVSLAPAVAPSAAVRIVDAARLDDAILVLPAVEADIGSKETVPAASDLPAGRFFIHLRLTVGEVPGVGREREALIGRELGELVAALRVDRPSVAGIIVEPAGTGTPEDVLQYTLEMLMVRLQAGNPKLEVALALPDDMANRSFEAAARLMAYADSLVVPAAALPGFDTSKLQAVAAGKPIVVHAPPAPGGGADSAARAWLDLLMTPGAASAASVWVEAGDLPALRALADTVRRIALSLASGFEMTAPERAPIAVMADGKPVAPAVAFVGSQSADIAFLLKTGATPASPRQLSLSADAAVTKAARVECLDVLSGLNLGASAAGTASPGCRVDADYVLLRASVPSGSDRLFEAVRVTGRSSLRVEEIIARWQAAREMQRLRLDDYSVPCFLGIHFEIPNLATSFDVALELREFVDRSGVQDWLQTAFRVNGVKLRKDQEFPLPQIEPDKIVTRPLELRIDEKYAYQLLGTETVDGRVCFVVSIKPAQPGESLYSGKVWIDGLDFRQVRLQLEQRDGKNNVAAHVETQDFELVKDAKGQPFNLVRSIYAEDSLNLAGRSVTVEKRYLFGEYAINAPDFAERLKAALASNDPMFRDTGDGLRALRKNAAGQRVVEPVGAKRVRALVGGVLYDGSRSYPIPLAGLSWVDFDWRKTGMQLSAFFAGPIFIGNLSRQVNKDFRWGVDLSLIALPFNYYDYSGNAEVTAQRVRSFEQYVGGLVDWQATVGLDFTLQADLLYDLYRAADVTSPGYRLPASGFTIDTYGQAKYVRKSFTAMATLQHGTRLGWRPFGYADNPAVTFPDYTRYSFELSQHVFVGKLTRGGVSVGYYGGSHLDRFSQYSPSFLERPTMHGIPSGVDSFDQVTTLSGYYGFNVADLAKLEGYYTHAWTTNRLEGPGVRQFDGLDASIGVAGPFGTFVQGTVSFAIRGNLERYSSRWGMYLIFLKPLKK